MAAPEMVGADVDQCAVMRMMARGRLFGSFRERILGMRWLREWVMDLCPGSPRRGRGPGRIGVSFYVI